MSGFGQRTIPVPLTNIPANSAECSPRLTRLSPLCLAAKTICRTRISNKPIIVPTSFQSERKNLTMHQNKQADPTPRQLQLLRAISNFKDSRCYSPTIAELANILGTSRSTVFEHISELRKKALLSTSQGKARSLRTTAKAQKLLRAIQKNNSSDFAPQHREIPLLGRVAAGVPIEAIEDKSFSLDTHFSATDETFALEVTGDSMIDEDIRDGDFVICRRSPTAHNGQLVIAIVDDENATLKRFYREEKRLRLQPANEHYSPIYPDNCRIEAVVVGLVRKI